MSSSLPQTASMGTSDPERSSTFACLRPGTPCRPRCGVPRPPVEALVGQYVVHQVACDEVGVGEQQLQHVLHFSAPVGRDEALDVVGVNLSQTSASDEDEDATLSG